MTKSKHQIAATSELENEIRALLPCEEEVIYDQLEGEDDFFPWSAGDIRKAIKAIVCEACGGLGYKVATVTFMRKGCEDSEGIPVECAECAGEGAL